MSGHTFKESREAGKLFHVAIPSWKSGGLDTHADSPAQAALLVGCAPKEYGFGDVPIWTQVSRHLPGSSIGALYLEPCGVFPTLTPDHYDI